MTRSKQQTLLLIFGFIFVINIINEIGDAIASGRWAPVIGQLFILALFGFFAYHNRAHLQTFRTEYRKKFEENTEHIGMKDAALFSLTWSKEIYEQIPADRKKLVNQAFTLIGVAFVVILFEIGFSQLLTIIICAALILAGVNLLVWVVSTERSEKNVLHVELRTARDMQMRLMPKEDPVIPGLDISGMCNPALNVGGDVFDYFFPCSEQAAVGIAVADVAGKGMEAALTAVFTSGALISETLHETEPARIMSNLNKTVCSRHNKNRFVSMLLVTIDRTQNKIFFVNAGQSKPLLFHGGEVDVLENVGARFPLGVVDDPGYQDTSVDVTRGDILLLYTDGLTEAMNVMQEPFGIERLRKSMKDAVMENSTSKTIIETIRRNISFYAGSVEQSDDMTMVVVRFI